MQVLTVETTDPLFLPATHRPVQAALQLSPCTVPDYCQFQYGTCCGALRVSETAYEVLAVFNEEPGNGDFACLLRHLIALAKVHGRDIVALEVHNEVLYPHLLTCWQMQPIKGTASLLLPVAGPGTYPAAVETDPQAAQLDYLLRVLHQEAASIW